MRSQNEVVIVADRVLRSLDVPLGVASTDVRVGASIGIAFGGLQSTAEDLLRQADVAMYAAKHGGKGGYVIFEFLRRWRSRVRGLILIDTRAEADGAEARRARDAAAATARESGAEAVAQAMLPKVLSPATLEHDPDTAERTGRTGARLRERL